MQTQHRKLPVATNCQGQLNSQTKVKQAWLCPPSGSIGLIATTCTDASPPPSPWDRVASSGCSHDECQHSALPTLWRNLQPSLYAIISYVKNNSHDKETLPWVSHKGLGSQLICYVQNSIYTVPEMSMRRICKLGPLSSNQCWQTCKRVWT